MVFSEEFDNHKSVIPAFGIKTMDGILSAWYLFDSKNAQKSP